MYPLIFFALAVAVVLIGTALLQWLWNITLPEAFDGAKKIEYWVAFRLLLIGSLLSGGVWVRFGGSH